jgi:hypothetical protein
VSASVQIVPRSMTPSAPGESLFAHFTCHAFDQTVHVFTLEAQGSAGSIFEFSRTWRKTNRCVGYKHFASQ